MSHVTKEHVVKNYPAITGMWFVIVAILFLAVPGLNLLLSAAGLGCGLYGIKYSQKHREGKAQSWFDVIGGGLLTSIYILTLMALLIGAIASGIDKKQELKYLSRFTVDGSSESELADFAFRYEDFNKQYKVDSGQEVKYDAVKEILAGLKAESDFKALVKSKSELNIEAEVSNGNLNSLGMTKIGILQVIREAEVYPDLVTAEQLQLFDSHLKKVESQIAILEEQARKKQREKEQRINSLKAKVRKKYNEFDEITWYTHSNIPKYANIRSYISVYFQVSSKSGYARNLRVKNLYTADDWLFIESYTIKTDHHTYSINKGQWGVERDNYTDIWEWYDDPVDAETKEMLLDISNSKKVMIRYIGSQYHKDRTLKSSEKKAIGEMLELFELMQSVPLAFRSDI